MTGRALAVTLGFALASGALLAPEDVSACGGFFARRNTTRPSLAHEQVLLVHDAATGTEHFIREVAFRAGTERFGFVVPTPGRPEVAKVNASPFAALRGSFPFSVERPSDEKGGFGASLGRLGGVGHGPTVLDVKKVGSFTAFVLAADDERGLATWLTDNGLVATAEAEAWLAHYVRMRFFFVAMRYDPPAEIPDAGVAPPIKAETIRISFPTPAPYYPYFEPLAPDLGDADGGTGASRPPRLLELWTISRAAVTPIAARTEAGKTSWVRPMQEGAQRWDEKRDVIALDLSADVAALLPDATLAVQVFQDQKSSREGYGDVLFAPRARTALDAASTEKLRPLLGVLDPALVPEKGAGR